MKCLLLLWMIIGSCCGLQEQLLYKYKYFGTVGTGIPELSGQQAGWAMKADVEVYVEQDDVTAVFQLYDVKMAEYNVDLGCDIRQDVPEELFHRYEDESLNQALEQPFKVHLFNYTDYTIEHSEDYYKLLVNLRKGIASIFKSEIIKENFVKEVEKPSRRLPSVFSRQEDTIFGSCQTEYAFHLIPEYLAGTKNNELEAYVEEDVQRDDNDETLGSIKKTSKKTTYKSSKKSSRRKTTKTSQKYTSKVPELKDDLWHVVRSVNFDNCDERADFQMGPVIGVYGDLNGGQYEWIKGRSSVSEYIFRGSPGHMRLESATVEGATLMAPFGLKSELIQARTNQTLHLVSVTTKMSAATMPSNLQQSITWMFEVRSFASPPEISLPYDWVTYTGKSDEPNYFGALGMDPLSAEKKEQIKTSIIENVKRVSLYLTDLDQEEDMSKYHTGDRVEHLLKSATLFKHLNKAEVLEIFDIIFKKDVLPSDVMARKLIVDVAAASGTYFTNSAILKYIKEGKLSSLQIMTYFMTLTTYAEDPLNVPELIDYVLSLDIRREPFLAATALVNVAEYLHKLCIDPDNKVYSYAAPFYGDNVCDIKMVKERFLPYLKDIIYSEDTTWEKDFALTALRSLGTPLSFPIVADVIKGKVRCSETTRVLAIYVLDPYKIDRHDHICYEIIDLLTEIFSNIQENSRVRGAALEIMVFWKPQASFWHRLAKASWREPSKNFAIFMSSIIGSFAALQDPYFAGQTKAASFALKLAKPVLPCAKYSYFADWDSSKIDRHLYKYKGLSWHPSTSPEEKLAIYFQALYRLGEEGFEISLLEMHGTFKPHDNESGEKKGFKGIPKIIAESAYNRILETLKPKIIRQGEVGGELHMKFFDHMSIYFPLTEETLQTVMKGGPLEVGSLFAQLALGNDLILGKFITPVNINSFVPTELGIPLSVSSTTSLLGSYNTYLTLDASKMRSEDMLAGMKLSSEEMTCFTSYGHSSIFAILPWSENVAISGVVGIREITLPLNGVITKEVKDSNLPESYHLDMQSRYKREFTMSSAVNVPYSGFVELLPLTSSIPDIKIIHKSPPKTEVFDLLSAYTGLDFKMTWTSGMAYPNNPWEWIDLISEANIWSGSWYPWPLNSKRAPSVEYWQNSLIFNPENSQTKNISFDFSIGTYGKEREDMTQFTQESNGDGQYDQDDYGQHEQESFDSQQSFDVDQGFQEFGGTDEVETTHQIRYDDSENQRSEKMQRLFGGPVRVANLKVHLEGSESRSYEIGYSYTKTKVQNERKTTKSQLSLIRSPIPDIDDKSSSIYLDVQKRTPVLSPLDTVNTFLDMNLDKEVKAELTLGYTGKPAATFRGTYHLSEEWKLKLLNNSQECNYDPYNPLFSLRSNAIYDDLKYTLTWEEICDTKKYPMTSKLFGIIENLNDINLLKDVCTHPERERKIEIHAHRCPVSENWFVAVGHELSKLHFKEVPHNDFLDFALNIGGNEYFSENNEESDQCVLGIDSVRTFDGFTYEYSPTECWTVAAKDCRKEKGPMLLIRSPSSESVIPEAKYIDAEKGLIIEYSGNEIKVNGQVVVITTDYEVIKNKEGEVIFVIFYKHGYFMIRFLQDFFISFKDKIRIHVPIDKRGHMCGLCGNYDGEPESELVGPHRCFYDDPKLFATAWAAESDTCDLYTLLGLRENVEKFQDTCHTIESLRESCPYYNERCMKFRWMVPRLEPELCVSSSPLPYCDEDCDWTEYHNEKVGFNCWPAEDAPEEIKNVVDEKPFYITTPIGYDSYYYEDINLSVPKSCKKE